MPFTNVFTQEKKTGRVKKIENRNRHYKQIEIFLIVIVGAMLAFVIYEIQTEKVNIISQSRTVKIKSPAEIKQLIEREKQNPAIFLRNFATIRNNILGKKIIKGSITNVAYFTTYKNITLQVSFLTKMKDIVGGRDFILYGTLQPGQSIPYKFKTDIPDSISLFAINVVNAEAVN